MISKRRFWIHSIALSRPCNQLRYIRSTQDNQSKRKRRPRAKCEEEWKTYQNQILYWEYGCKQSEKKKKPNSTPMPTHTNDEFEHCVRNNIDAMDISSVDIETGQVRVVENKVNTIDGGINAKQDSLYASLKYLYVSDRFKYGQELEKYSLDLYLKILESREEFSWYANTLLGQPYTQDEISYYIDNPLYRNHIATVSKLTLSQFKVHLTAWEQILLSNYKRVYDYLEEENV